MAYKWESILKPEGSVVSGIATAGAVYAIYQLNGGDVATIHASDANHPAITSSVKKAGLEAFILVGALTLMTKDSGVGILGFGSIIAMSLSYRHASMVSPQTGKMQAPSTAAYTPAGDNQDAVTTDDTYGNMTQDDMTGGY